MDVETLPEVSVKSTYMRPLADWLFDYPNHIEGELLTSCKVKLINFKTVTNITLIHAVYMYSKSIK